MTATLPQFTRNDHFSGLWKLLRLAAVFVFISAFTPLYAGSALSGTYTVCGSGCDYKTVTLAMSDLATNGVSGKVLFKVKAGNYNEQLSLSSAISGASAANTVTFQGEGAMGSSPTRIYYNGGTVLSLNSASYLQFKDIFFENTGTGGYTTYMYATSHVRFVNCQIKLSTSNYSAVVNSSGCSNLYYDKCRFYGGGTGIQTYNTSSYKSQDTVQNSSIVQFNFTGMYSSYGTNDYVFNNRIDSASAGSSSTTYGIQMSHSSQCTIAGNYIMTGYCLYAIYTYGDEISGNTLGMPSKSTYCMYINYADGGEWFNNKCSAYGTALLLYYPNNGSKSTPLNVYNNFFSTPLNGGVVVSIYDNQQTSDINVHFLHNTVYTASSQPTFNLSNSSTGWDIRNNNFYKASTSNYCFFINSVKSGNRIEGNNYYQSSGTLIYAAGNSFSTISDWQTYAAGFGYGKYDQSINTSFKSAPSDLHYTSSSSLPSGLATSIGTDIDLDQRCGVFATSGADEGSPSWSLPSDSFTGPKNIVEGTQTTFLNAAKPGDRMLYRWYINGVLASDSIDLYTTKISGSSVKITLVSINCKGKDSVTKTFTVSKPTTVPGTDFVADKNTAQKGEKVSLKDVSTGYPSGWLWHISPASVILNGKVTPTYTFVSGDSTIPNPQLVFNVTGTYKICLSTWNSVGKGSEKCKTDYIEVIGANTLTTASPTVHESKGFVYDAGGPYGNYTYSTAPTSIHIEPYCADTVYLVFNSFDLYCGFDYIRVYDGTDALSGKEIKKCSMSSYVGLTGGASTTACTQQCLPGTYVFAAPSGKMYIEMTTNIGYSLSGFEAYYWSNTKAPASITAKFTAPDSACPIEAVKFTNATSGKAIGYQWDLDGNLATIEDTAASPSYTYTKPGTYKVSLIVRNCSTSDTFSKNIAIRKAATPVADFTADNTNPTTNDYVTLSSLTQQCVDSYYWDIKKKYGSAIITFANNTTKNSPQPQVLLPDTGCYDVTLYVHNAAGLSSSKKTCFLKVKNSYCTPEVSNVVKDIGISEVHIGTLDNKSTQTGTYENYIQTKSVTLEIGAKYGITISRTTNSNTAVRTVYIDWNHDGDFADAGEDALDESSGRNKDWTDTIRVAAGLQPSATVMRIAINVGSMANDPCVNDYGEYEDYRLYLVKDKTKPELKLIGDDSVTMEIGGHYTDPGVKAMDNVDGDLTGKVVRDSAGFNANAPGIYIFTYTVTDKAGNTGTITRKVTVFGDKTPPVLTVNSNDTIFIEVNTTFTPPTATAMDAHDGIVQPVITGTADTGHIGLYVLEYSAEDKSGNKSTRKIVVIVEDNTPPVVTLIGDSIIYLDPYVTVPADPGITVTDNYSDKAHISTFVTGSVNTNILGTYILTYGARDEVGNLSNIVHRTYIVRDTTRPSIKMLGNDIVKVDVYSKYSDPGVIVNDNYDNNLKAKITGTFYDAFPDGTGNIVGWYTIIYTATDKSGNTSSVTRNVNVGDFKAPDIQLKGQSTANICRWKRYNDEGYTVSDNYSPVADITVTIEGSFLTDSTLLPGIYTLRYNAVDKAGNVGKSDYRVINVKSETDGECYTGITDPDATERQFSIYPNPSQGVFTIRYALPGQATITVSDMLGRNIQNLSLSATAPGLLQLDMSNQPAGVYQLTIRTENQVITQQIILNK